jgi:hypothetical protein
MRGEPLPVATARRIFELFSITKPKAPLGLQIACNIAPSHHEDLF